MYLMDISLLIKNSLKNSMPPEGFTPRRALGDLPADMQPPKPWKPAAVLVPVVLHEPQPTILLTERTRSLLDHAGQVSFPGGRRESTDSNAVQTALRETYEETGLERSWVEPAGFLDGYLTITGYAVTPVVGLVRPGFTLKPDPIEVAEIFEVPLAFLRDPANRQTRKRILSGRELGYYVFEYGRHHIWGATAAMLVNFLQKLERAGST